MSAITFTLMVAPMSLQASGKRMIISGGRPRFFKSKEAEAYQRAIEAEALPYRPASPFTGPLIVNFTFVLPRPQKFNAKKHSDGLIPCISRPDRDNLQKGTQDALKGFWLDDAQIYDGRVAKYYAERGGDPRIIVEVQNNESMNVQAEVCRTDPHSKNGAESPAGSPNKTNEANVGINSSDMFGIDFYREGYHRMRENRVMELREIRGLRKGLRDTIAWCAEQQNAGDVTTLGMVQERLRYVLTSPELNCGDPVNPSTNPGASSH